MSALLQNIGVVAGLPMLAGLRPYGTLFLVGLLRRLDYLESSIYLRADGLEFLENTAVLAVCGGLFVAELLVDKIPIVDHIADTVHMVGKPVVGGLFGAVGVEGLADGVSTAIAGRGVGAVGGGGVTLATHAAKSSVRVMSTKFTGGMGNIVLSIAEDAVILPGFYLVGNYPIVAGVIVVCVLGLTIWLFSHVWRTLRKGGNRVIGGIRRLVGEDW